MILEADFTVEDIADLEDLSERNAPHIGNVYAPPELEETDNGEEPIPSADWRDDWTLTHEGIPFRLHSTVRQAREEIIGGRLTATGKWVLVCPPEYIFNTKQRIELIDINRVYEILGYVSESFEMDVESRYECDEVG